MGEILILRSTNKRILTDKLINSWFDTNEMFITKKIFSDDQYSVEVTFIDEERAEMISDLLNTCYGDYIEITRPQILIQSLDNSIDEERVPSPVHLSSALSISSKRSGFSQRLIALDRKQNNDQIKLAVGRGRGIDTKSTKIDMSRTKDVSDDDDGSIINSNATSPTPSVISNAASLLFGRGRGAVFK